VKIKSFSANIFVNKWIDLRETKTKMITVCRQIHFTSKNASFFVIFVCNIIRERRMS